METDGESFRPFAPETSQTRQNAWLREAAIYGAAAALVLARSLEYGVRHGMNAGDMISEIARVYPIGATEFIRDSHL